jgi:hypothetical protein
MALIWLSGKMAWSSRVALYLRISRTVPAGRLGLGIEIALDAIQLVARTLISSYSGGVRRIGDVHVAEGSTIEFARWRGRHFRFERAGKTRPPTPSATPPPRTILTGFKGARHPANSMVDPCKSFRCPLEQLVGSILSMSIVAGFSREFA